MIINDFESSYEETLNLLKYNNNYIFLLSNDVSKYSIKDKFPTQMLVLGIKNNNFKNAMNLTLEYKANITILINDDIMVFYPLGNIFYKGNNIKDMFKIIINRLNFLNSITRQKTISIKNNNIKLNWYFDMFAESMIQIKDKITIPDCSEFLDIVRNYAQQYYDLFEDKTDNHEFKRTMRCRRGMPSFRYKNNIIVSKRIITNEFITNEDMVAIYKKGENIYYYGDDKPSVDTPIHVKLYKEFNHINFIIHSHEYIKNAPFTKKVIPCGAIEEYKEIITTIKENFNYNNNLFIVNELGHGSIILSSNLENLKQNEIKKRVIPDFI